VEKPHEAKNDPYREGEVHQEAADSQVPFTDQKGHADVKGEHGII
jgi:hypothetical protein